jgi:uncharacterized protein
MVHVTEFCNLACVYCWEVDKKPRYMTVETARKTVDWFLDRNVSGAVEHIDLTFFGGEPFTRLEVIEEAVAHARKPRPNTFKSMRFSATTNATVSGPRVERIVRDASMSLLVSVDGSEEANTSRRFHSGRPSFPIVARNIRAFASWDVDVVARMTFTPENLDFAGNVERVLDLGVRSVVLAPVLEADWRGREAAVEEAYQVLAERCIAEARAGKMLPLEITNQYLRQIHRARNGGGRPARPCGVGSWLMSVDTDGNVLPCHRWLYRRDEAVGTVERPIMDEARWKYVHLSSSDIVGCETCFARAVCGGGCRAAALTAGLGLYDAHPAYCVTTRAHVRAAEHVYDTLSGEQNPTLAAMLRSASSLSPAFSELSTR